MHVESPSVFSYVCNVAVSIIPKVIVIACCIVIGAFRGELFSAVATNSDSRDLPLRICLFVDKGDNVYGDRVCNNALASAIASILVAQALMVIDLHIPCIIAKFKRLAHFLNLIWGLVLAVYWLITSALLADLYRRYCDEDENDCGGNEAKFITFPTIGFICVCAWSGQACISFIRMCIGK